MKITVLIAIPFFFLSSYIEAETLIDQNLLGEWGADRGYWEPVPTTEEMKSVEISLSVIDFNNVVLTRKYDDGSIKRFQSSEFKKIGNLFWFKFNEGEDVAHELTLGGWVSNSKSKSLFGHLYLINVNTGLFNGWPVRLKPKNSANKAFKSPSAGTAQSAAL